MSGLVGTGLQYRNRGLELLGQSAALEQRGNEERQMQKDAERAQLGSNVATGAILGGTGALAGLGIAGGPVGIAAGAIGGAILGSLF